MKSIRTLALALWLTLGCVTVCTGSCSLGQRGQYQWLSRLEDDGVLVEAKVMGRREVSAEKRASDYYLSYRFRVGTDADGEEVTHEESVDYHRYVKTHEGDSVTVRYSRSDPDVWDIPDERTAAVALAVARSSFKASIVAGVMFVLMAVVLLYLRYRFPRERSILRSTATDPISGSPAFDPHADRP